MRGVWQALALAVVAVALSGCGMVQRKAVGMVASTLGCGALAGHIGYRPVFVVAGLLALTSVGCLARLREA